MRLWLGSDRTISRNLGLLIPHSVLNSLYFIFFFFCANKVTGEARRLTYKFKKYYSAAPFTFLFLRVYF